MEKPFIAFSGTPDEYPLSRYQLFEVLKNLNQTITLLNREGEILYSNPHACAVAFDLFMKYPAKDGSIWEYLLPENHTKFKELMLKTFQGEMVRTPVMFIIKGQDIWFDYTFFPLYEQDGKINTIAVCSSDITAQKIAEEKLKENEALYHAVIQDQTELICRYSYDGIINFVNSSYCDFFGLTGESLIGKCWFDFIPEFLREEMHANLKKLNPDHPVNHYDKMVMDGKGNPRWFLCTDKASFDVNEKIIEIQSVAKDISAYKTLEIELRNAKLRFEMILKAIPDPIFVFDEHGTILDCFASDPGQLVIPINEIINNNIHAYLPGDVCAKTVNSIQNCLSGKANEVLEYDLVIDSKKQYFEAKFVRLETNKVLCISRNITVRKEAEEQMVNSESLYKQLVDTLSDSIFILSSDLKILFASPSALRLFEYGNSLELLGKEMFHWVENDYKNFFTNELTLLTQEGKKILYRCRMIKKDGKDFPAEINGTPIKSQNGNIWGILVVVKDITTKLSYKHRIKLLYEAIEQCPVAVLITNKLGEIEYVNSIFHQYTGYTKEEVIGKNPSILKSGKQSKEVYTDLWNHILNGKEWQGKVINRRKDGTLYWESSIIAPVKNSEGEITHFIAVKEDITKRMAFESELMDAKNRAEEMDRLKTSFLENVSHEIRTPMNAIIGFSDLLNQELHNPDKVTKFTRIISEGCNKLLSIITDIVDISKIEAGLVNISNSSVELSKLMDNIKSKLGRIASLNGIEVRITCDPAYPELIVRTDVSKLTQVITHLLSNAIKFSRNSFIDVGYYVKGQNIEFVVKDNGIGISPEFHEAIFELFWQHQNKGDIRVGMGLGLSISKSMVEQMGGKIWFESETGVGSTFCFVIPLENAALNNATQIGNKSSNDFLSLFNQKIILIADDEEINYQYLEELLQKVGVDVKRARDGEEAVLMAMNNKFNLILMDLRMPKLDGFNASRIIRRRFPKLPIIAISVSSEYKDDEKAREVGCDFCITGPLEPIEFYELLSKFLVKSE